MINITTYMSLNKTAEQEIFYKEVEGNIINFINNIRAFLLTFNSEGFKVQYRVEEIEDAKELHQKLLSVFKFKSGEKVEFKIDTEFLNINVEHLIEDYNSLFYDLKSITNEEGEYVYDNDDDDIVEILLQICIYEEEIFLEAENFIVPLETFFGRFSKHFTINEIKVHQDCITMTCIL